MPSRHLRLYANLTAAFAFLTSSAAVPAAWCSRRSADYAAAEAGAQMALARGVRRHLDDTIGANRFQTGSQLFNEEWAFGTYVMATLGLAQLMLEHPEQREALLPALRESSAQLMKPELRSFGTKQWGSDLLADAPLAHGHAYFGYQALALSVSRLVDPNPPWAAEHDRALHALARRLRRQGAGVIETYPGEAYPVDVAAIVAALAVHDRETRHGQFRAIVDDTLEAFRTRFRDPTTGLLAQSVDPSSGLRGTPRGSGTALASYFLAFADRELAAAIYQSLDDEAFTSLAGFGAIREYARSSQGHGDIDSGPVVLGVGVSATGFALAPAKMFDRRGVFESLLATTTLFGMPSVTSSRSGDVVNWASGGPLGDAILLAMLTAGPGTAPPKAPLLAPASRTTP